MTKRRLFAAVAATLGGAILLANAVVLAGGGDAQRSLPQADCVLVLGAGVRDDGSPSDVLRDRLDEALALWRAGRAARILVTGDHRAHEYDEPNTMRAYLEANGVPPEVIFMDHAGVDTYSSMWRARHVFGASRVLVVTQRFHLARSVWVARSLGMEAEGRAADRRTYRGIGWLHAREIGSRTKAVVDVAVGREPRHRGPRIPLDGDGRVTAG